MRGSDTSKHHIASEGQFSFETVTKATCMDKGELLQNMPMGSLQTT